MTTTNFLTLLFIVLALDVLTTIYFLRIGIKEGNARVAGWMQRFGPRTTLYVSKLAVYVLFVYVAADVPNWLRWALVVGGAGVVLWNVRAILRARGGLDGG